jgi:hypothetical protein
MKKFLALKNSGMGEMATAETGLFNSLKKL